jgi:CMP-N-acetylneuraminic acid synthetase
MGSDSASASLAVIPCRGGSKRVPKKNIRDLRGRPAVAYTIDAALESGIFRSVIVSTDSDEIAEVARGCGAEVPFLRDSALADDFTPISAVTLDALERVDPHGSRFDHIAQLMANCPLRTAEDIRASYGQFLESGADTQISVMEYGWMNPWWAMSSDEQHTLSPMFKEMMVVRSQDQPRLFCPTGVIWWARADALRKHGTFYAPGYRGWSIPWQRGVDIDTEDDWEMAELLMELAER